MSLRLYFDHHVPRAIEVGVRQQGIDVLTTDADGTAHTIAQIAIEMSKSGSPLDVVFGWSLGSALRLALEFVLFGQGDVPNSVIALLQKAIPDAERRPTVLVG